MSTVKKRVLVVDDDPELVASVRAALLTRGYDVSVAGDGAEALAQIERTRPDLMLLDLVMPRRSGINVLDRMVRGAQISMVFQEPGIAPSPVMRVRDRSLRSCRSDSSGEARLRRQPFMNSPQYPYLFGTRNDRVAIRFHAT